MIPITVTILEEEVGQSISPSLTYKIDYFNKKLIGKFDGRDAVVQSILKILSTDRYAFVVYDWYYGQELMSLIGQPYDYVVTELPRLIEEALLQDDRIVSVQNFKFKQSTVDSMLVEFTVQTVYGLVEVETEVVV